MANPYELWQTRKLLGVYRATKPETWYFGQFFTAGQMRSETEWIDFEKLPLRSRKLAPFVQPMGRGHGVDLDKAQGLRFKPANLVVEDPVDPLKPLTYQPGIDSSLLDFEDITPERRLQLIKAMLIAEHRLYIERRWEWMKARAIIDGQVTCNYKDGTSVVVDFRRDADHTEVLTSGNRWGDAGVSILDKIKQVNDTMANAEHGGAVTRITMGGSVAPIVQKSAEILAHMDINTKGGVHSVDRGIMPSAKVFKLGEVFFGGQSGQKVELWVNNETYTADNGTETRYLGANEVLFTSTAEAIGGWECFGRIIDPDAKYQPVPIFPKNFVTGERVKTENLSAESAPLFVPINPDATYKLTATA